MGSFSGLPWKRPSTTPASDTAKRTENIQSLLVLKNFRLKLIYPNAGLFFGRFSALEGSGFAGNLRFLDILP